MKTTVLVALVTLTLTACYAEGYPTAVEAATKERYLTMSQCDAEAARMLRSGDPKHPGFVCEGKVLGFTSEQQEYLHGELIVCAEPSTGGP